MLRSRFLPVSDDTQTLADALDPQTDAERELIAALGDSPLLVEMVERAKRRMFAEGAEIGRKERDEEQPADYDFNSWGL